MEPVYLFFFFLKLHIVGRMRRHIIATLLILLLLYAPLVSEAREYVLSPGVGWLTTANGIIGGDILTFTEGNGSICREATKQISCMHVNCSTETLVGFFYL